MKIVAIGEVVWDIFPEREVLGGAPVNVAYHLAGLGWPVTVITRVGVDRLGVRAEERLRELGLPLAGVQRDEALPTGRVQVSFGPDREPAYDIVAPAAWDNIDPVVALAAVGAAAGAETAGRPAEPGPEPVPGDRLPFALVFGTLAQRAPGSRQAIQSLARRAALRFYDVNLRPPFTTPELVLASLELADLVKVNGDELLTIAAWLEEGNESGVRADDSAPAAVAAAIPPAAAKVAVAAALLRRYGLQAVVVTEGGAGAWVQTAAATHHAPGRPVKVVDTVGAGDAFFASLIAGCLVSLAKDNTAAPDFAGLPWPAILSRANERGAYVAGRAGATPSLPALDHS